MNVLILALRWREDVARGEMIQTKDWTDKFLDLSRENPPSLQIDAACEAANQYYARIRSPLRIVRWHKEKILLPSIAPPQIEIPFG